MRSHASLGVGKARSQIKGEVHLREGKEQREFESRWIQEHQAGVLECSYYPTYTYALRPHQPLLVGSILVIGNRQPLLRVVVLGISKHGATTNRYRTW